MSDKPKWRVSFYPACPHSDVMPLDGAEHVKGESCWCAPDVLTYRGVKDLVCVHKPQDNRGPRDQFHVEHTRVEVQWRGETSGHQPMFLGSWLYQAVQHWQHNPELVAI